MTQHMEKPIVDKSSEIQEGGVANLTFIMEEDDDPIAVEERNNSPASNTFTVLEPSHSLPPTIGRDRCKGSDILRNGVTITPPTRRRSSVEKTLRQSTTRALRRFSRAFTAVRLLPQSDIKVIGISEEDLLSRLFEAFDSYQTGKINQDRLIDILKMRLNQYNNSHAYSQQFEERRIDFVEIVESVSYAVAGSEDLNFETFSTVFRTKNVLNKLYRLIDRDLDGIVTEEQIMEFISQLSGARIGSRLTRDNIAYLEKLFRQYVGNEKEIKKSDFSKIIQTKNQFFTDRVFDIFDDDSNGCISLQEFLDAMHKFAGVNSEDKIRFLFKVYDVDGDGEIQEAELNQVMRACMEENGMNFSDEQIHELTSALFEDADIEGRGALTYDALKAQLEKHDGLLENLSISIERWLVPVKPIVIHQHPSLMTKLRSHIPHQFSSNYLKNNYVFVLWLFGFLLINFSLIVSRAVDFHYEHPCGGVCLSIAKATSQALNFNCSYILVMMLKKSLTFLRARGASTYLPIDQHLYLHKLAGYFIVALGLVHTIAHLINIQFGFIASPEKDISCNSIARQNWTYFEYLFLPAASLKFGLIPGFAFSSGVFIFIILSIMFVCSLPFVRRSGCFQVFYWTHLLYIFFWILLIIHGKRFWQWFIIPGIIFVIEQGVRIYNWRLGSGKTYISSGILLPSNVTHLIIRRPPNFRFQPGDYVFVRIPAIALYEWHPFTISSSPEQEDAIWLHVRAVGEWTSRLYKYFEEEQFTLNPGIWDFRSKTDAFTKGIKYKRRESVRKYLLNPLTSIPSSRPQLKSVADSVTSCTPESEYSSAGNMTQGSVSVATSEDVLNDSERIADIRKLRLIKMNSMPNVSERTMKNNSHDPRLIGISRFESVEMDTKNGIVSPNPNPKFPRSSRRSSESGDHGRRYLRYKRPIISFKTPLDEKEAEKTLRESLIKTITRQSSKDPQSLAEEGQEMSLEENPISACFELGTTRISREQLPTLGKTLEIFIDGPLGSPSNHIFRAEHAVLIATGIGVTPFASILQSIMRRYWASRNICPNCNFTWCSELPESVLNLKKVDFFWINRDQRSFEWFVHLLSQLEIEQAELGEAMERFLDMHMYITSALQKTDMKAVGLQLALDLLHEKEKRDLITGLKTRTNAGRPNWSKIFKQLQDQHKGKVTVFFCGPPALGRTIKLKCDEYGFSFRKEIF